ncbi:MAG: DUF1015 domain-containing protein [Phycisphaerae bacterium]
MEIRPFKGWRYNVDSGDVSNLLAPPYDILSGEDKQALLEQDPANIVAVDLPHVPPKEVGPDSAYEKAASLLQQWQRDGLMKQDGKPALYVYEQTYSWAGKTHTRRAMLAGLRATELGEDVMPHEHTFDGPKADRMKLTEHTGLQMSPIFGFHTDPDGMVGKILAKAAADQPALQGTLRGVTERLWVIDDEQDIRNIQDALEDVKAYIADGHHRYTTAMDYARGLRVAGTIDDDHQANFVMFALVAEDNEGLIVLPTHRLVHGLSCDYSFEALLEQLGEDFDLTEADPAGANLADADALLADYGPHAIALVGPDAEKMVVATLKSAEPMRAAAPDECAAWQKLDVAILHKLILEKALAPWTTAKTDVEYTPDGNAAWDACKEGNVQLAAILRGTPLAAVRDIADAGASMPHKSTYFYPKLATGMVLKPLDLEE